MNMFFESPHSVLLVVNQFSVAKTKKFIQFHRGKALTVVAIDSVISQLLTTAGIKNYCVDDFISVAERETIQQDATNIIFATYNRILDDTTLPRVVRDFFDCTLFELIDPLLHIYFYAAYCKMLLIKLQPTAVHLFDYKDFISSILKTILATRPCAVSIIPLTFFDKVADYVGHGLPYIAREPLYYRPYIRRLGFGRLLDSIESHRKNNPLTAAVTDILVGCMSSRSQILEFLPLFAELRSRHATVRTTVSARLLRRDYSLLRKHAIPYSFLSSKKEIEAFSTTPEIKNALAGIYGQLIVSTGIDSDVLRQTFINLLDLNQRFFQFLEHRKRISDLIRATRPKLLLCCTDFSFISRIHLLVAKQQRLTAVGVSQTSDQQKWARIFSCFTASDELATVTLPEFSLVAVDAIKRIYSRLNSDRRDHALVTVGSLKLETLSRQRRTLVSSATEIRKRILEKLNLPDTAQFILFTTQQHNYSFAYCRLVSQAISELCKRHEFRDLFLLVRPNPVEFNALYSLFGRRRADTHVIINNDMSLYESIIASEFLVTSFSFTASEAALLGRRTLYLDFLPLVNRPEIFEPNFSVTVTSANQLQPVLTEMLRSTATNGISFSHDSSQIFADSSNSINRHADACMLGLGGAHRLTEPPDAGSAP